MRQAAALALLLALVLAWPARAGDVVPPNFRVTDFSARAALARLLAERGQSGDRQEALALFATLRQERLGEPDALLDLARLAAELGRWRAARELADAAAGHPRADERIRLEAAELGNSWGAFRCVAAAWTRRLEADPSDPAAGLGLARALLAMQRRDEARGRAQALLRGPAGEDPGVRYEALALLAHVEMQAKDFPAAAQAAAAALILRPDDVGAGLLRAEALLRAGRLAEALDAALALAAVPAVRVEALLLRARIRSRLDDPEGARDTAGLALAAKPGEPRALVFLLDAGRPDSPQRAAGLLDPAAQPRDLLALGQALAEAGYFDSAATALQLALDRDPDFDPARPALAEALAAAGRHAEALEVLDALARDFPDSDKTLLARARTLSWDRRYAESLEAYAALSRADPADPVPQREAARVAYWAKDPARGQELYAGLAARPVDRELAERLQDLGGPAASDAATQARRNLAARADSGPAGDGYAAAQAALPSLTPAEQEAVRAALADLAPEYRTQKAAQSEARAKDLAFNGRFAPAGRALEELASLEPGNEEALFDLAQVRCAQGLCDQEAAAYRRLLDLDPLHSLAGYALERLELRTAPALGSWWRMWDEEGRGDLARMTRHRGQAWAEAPFMEGRGAVRLGQDLYLESPRLRGAAETASGQTLGLAGVASGFLSGSGEISIKDYADPDLDDHWLGRAAATLNADDRARLRLSFRREDVLANDFALRQGVLADAWRAELSPVLGRKLSARLGAERASYSDGNSGEIQDAEAGFAFTDHPRTFKVILAGERRDTAEKSGFFYQEERLADVSHPYWTPRDYYGGALTLEWRHDLAEDQFCGAPQNVYDLKLTLGQDTDHNPSARLTGTWKVELDERWSLDLSAMVHESDQWDARAAFIGLSWRLGPRPGGRP